MTTAHHRDPERERRLNQILLAYVEAIQEGRTPDRRRLLSDNPEFAHELKEFFALRDQIDRLAAPLREVALAATSPGVARPESGEPGALAPGLWSADYHPGANAGSPDHRSHSILGSVGNRKSDSKVSRFLPAQTSPVRNRMASGSFSSKPMSSTTRDQ